MDERFEPYYCEDTDLIYRVEKAGKRIIQDKRITVRHLKSFTINQQSDKDAYMVENCKRFKEKHGFDPVPYQHP